MLGEKVACATVQKSNMMRTWDTKPNNGAGVKTTKAPIPPPPPMFSTVLNAPSVISLPGLKAHSSPPHPLFLFFFFLSFLTGSQEWNSSDWLKHEVCYSLSNWPFLNGRFLPCPAHRLQLVECWLSLFTADFTYNQYDTMQIQLYCL